MRRFRVNPTLFIAYALLCCASLVVLAPLVWTIVSSFRPAGDIFSHSLPTSWQDFTLENYVGLYDDLAIFNRALSGEEVVALHQLETGVAGLYP